MLDHSSPASPEASARPGTTPRADSRRKPATLLWGELVAIGDQIRLDRSAVRGEDPQHGAVAERGGGDVDEALHHVPVRCPRHGEGIADVAQQSRLTTG